MLATWRIGPALAAGNTVVLKPPEWAPLTASLLADITPEAGLPAGVFNVVQGTGPTAGAALDPAPRHQPAVVHRLGADRRTDRRGGRAEHRPAVVRARRQVAAGRLRRLRPRPRGRASRSEQFDNAGQVCLGAFRMLVEEAIAEEFLAAVVEKARAISSRATRATKRTDVGALISRPHFERVDGFVQRAMADGAEAVLGGGPNEDSAGSTTRRRSWSTPKPGSEILTEEVFGPVLTMQTFGTEDEGVRDGQRHPLRPGRHAGHRRPRPGRAGQRPAQRRHRVGQLLLRPRPRRAVRRQRPVRHRPRGRRLVVRLLLRRQEHACSRRRMAGEEAHG